MKTRRRNFSDDRKGTENSEESIPIDLIVEILLRLTARSVARCRCVSTLWASILRRPDFTELFLTRSQTRPQILIAVEKHDKLSFLSAPQPQNPDVNSSPVVCANRLMHFPFDGEFVMCGPVHGLFCFMDKRRIEIVPVICNPSTGQSLPLPEVKMRRFGVKSFLGYDPIDKEFKVLSMSLTNYCVGNGVFDEHQILTIGGSGENMSWRMIQSCIPPHYSSDKGICINGVLYYLASEEKFSKLSMIVCFDVRSEKFSFITDSIRVVSEGDLINYNGKLGSVVCDRYGYVDGRNGRSGSIELWVLENAEKNEWSKHSLVLPAMWQNILGVNCLRFVGMTRTNEIVFSPIERMFFCVCYYNIERRTITKVEIQGMEAIEDNQVDLYLDHVEDVKLM